MASKLNIMVVEDHHLLRDAMVRALTEAGFGTVGVMSAEELDHVRPEKPPDVYILDLNLPGEDGFALSERLRALQPNCGIIMLTARNLKQDRIQGYRSGADVYLMKPTDLDELLAAVEALAERVGRTQPEGSGGLPLADVRLYCERREIEGPEGRESLTQREVSVLAALSRARLRQLEYWEIIELFGEDPESYQKASLEVAMTRLRTKLEKVGFPKGYLVALRGVGYLLKAPIPMY